MKVTGHASQSPLLDTFKVTGFEKRFAEMPSPSPPPIKNPFRIHPAKYYSNLMKNSSQINCILVPKMLKELQPTLMKL